MDTAVSDFGPHLHAEQLRQSWQGRVLAHVEKPFRCVVESVLACNFDETFPFLLRALDTWVCPPGLISDGKVDKLGRVCAHLIGKDGALYYMAPLFLSKQHMQDEFRRLADETKLTDAERVELFDALNRWIVCDYRLDPNMDPRDPDAKRLVM